MAYFCEIFHLFNLKLKNLCLSYQPLEYYRFESCFSVLDETGSEEKQKCFYYEKYLTQIFPK